MRALILLLVAIGMAGCAAPGVSRWTAADRAGVVAIRLCAACSSPYGHQVDSARELMKTKCGGTRFVVDEEGTDLNGGATAIDYGGGVAAVRPSESYYWAFHCLP